MSEIWTFTGRAAVVTGGLRGIGRAIAEALAAADARVHVFDRDGPADDAALPFSAHRVDIARPGEVARAVAGLAPAPLLLVNNAGITRDRTLMKMSDEEWNAVIDVNLTGAFNMLRAMAPAMVGAGFGRVVNITSINGLRGKFGQINYSAAKAGLVGLTKTAARELGPKGATVNAIAPGMVLTPMAMAAPEETPARALAETVIGRLAEPSDIANVALFLLSDAARMITGQVIRVDGGQYL